MSHAVAGAHGDATGPDALLPTTEHLVRWSPRPASAVDVDERRWHVLTAIGDGCSLAALAGELGGEAVARRAVRDLFAAGLVTVEEPVATRTAVRVPPRAPAIPVAVAPITTRAVEPTPAVPTAQAGPVATAPVAAPEPIAAAVPERDAQALGAPAGAAPATPATGTEPAATSTSPTATSAVVAPDLTDPDAGWGQAPQVEEDAGWDDPAPPVEPVATWDEAPAQDEPAGWDDGAVHVEDVVGWDDLAASATTLRAAATPAAPPAAAPAAATASPAVQATPVAPAAPTPVPAAPASSGSDPDDDAVSRGQLYQFLSSMRS